MPVVGVLRNLSLELKHGWSVRAELFKLSHGPAVWGHACAWMNLKIFDVNKKVSEIASETYNEPKVWVAVLGHVAS